MRFVLVWLKFTNYLTKKNQTNMGALKQYHHEYLTAEDFDLMFDDEYEYWLQVKKQEEDQYLEEKAAYEEALAAVK